MKTELELMREGLLVLDRICGCERLNCSVCRHRREVRAYLDVADGAAHRRAILDGAA